MAISELRDMRKRTQEYINKHVELEIEILPEKGDVEITEGETFEIKIKVKNSQKDPTKRIRLKNLTFRVESSNGFLAQLRVPSTFDGWEIIAPVVPVGTHLKEMVIKPAQPKDRILGVFGKSATLRLPTIPGNPAIINGKVKISVRIYSAEPDLDFLFPIIDGGDTSTDFDISPD